MINVYDTAHLLASQLKESEEYKEYKRLKDIAFEDGTNRTLLEELKRLQEQAATTSTSLAKIDEVGQKIGPDESAVNRALAALEALDMI